MLCEKDDEIKLLSAKLLSVRKEIFKIKKEWLDDSIVYELRDTFFFSGESLPKCTTGENTSSMVTALVKEKLKLNNTSFDISVSHRLGKKICIQQKDKHSTIAKFYRQDIRNHVLIQCRRSKPEHLNAVDLNLLWFLYQWMFDPGLQYNIIYPS